MRGVNAGSVLHIVMMRFILAGLAAVVFCLQFLPIAGMRPNAGLIDLLRYCNRRRTVRQIKLPIRALSIAIVTRLYLRPAEGGFIDLGKSRMLAHLGDHEQLAERLQRVANRR
jgi:hypothetical protein